MTTQTRAVPSLEETLAWLQRLPDVRKQPPGRFASLTVEDLRTLTELKPGGHTEPTGAHPVIQPDEFRYLTTLPALEKLILFEIDPRLTGETLRTIGQITTLTYLDLGDNQLTDAGLPHLRRLIRLRHLALWFTGGITDAGLPLLEPMQELETLKLSRLKIADAGLPALAKLPKLAALELNETPITDAGLDYLTSLCRVRLLEVKQTQVTEEGLTRFKAARPDVTIRPSSLVSWAERRTAAGQAS